MTSPSRRTRLPPAAVAALPLLTVAMIVWHECGHTVVAWLVGDPSARFHLVLHTARQSCIGCNRYDSAALDPVRNAVVNAAGVLATQLLAWGAVAAWPSRRRQGWQRWLLAEILFVTVAGDLIFQVVQGFLAGVPAREPVGRLASYSDASAVVSFLSQASGRSHALVAGIALSLVAADLLAMACALRVRRAPAPDRRPPALRR